MGVCLSRCGEAQHKAGVVAATISHQNSLDLDSKHSLKKFLHLYENAEQGKKSLSSPRDSLQIPHSSELFSLPDSDAERSSSCCISPSPARTSRASISSSPGKSNRNSFSAWGGRFSMDKAVSVGCRRKIRPARSSKSLTGEQDLAAHQRLVEAIARLERLNGGKNLELRGSSFCSSDLEKKVLPKSRSGSRFSGLGRRHYQPYQPSLPLLQSSTSSSKRHDHSCDESDDTSHCCSCTKNLLGRTSYVADAAASMLPTDSFSQPKTMGNLVSLAAPIIKQMPLEESVTNFLKEVESFVSLIEAPRLSLSSERKSGSHEPVIITTYSRSAEGGSTRFEDTDSDEQFTFFEATFGDRELREKESKSLKQMVNASGHRSLAAVDSTGDHPLNSVPDVVPEFVRITDKAMPTETLSISVDPIFELKLKVKTADASRPALTEIDPNVLPITRRSPSVSKSPLKMRAPRGIRRGFSRSLDSREGSVTKVDFNVLRNGSIQLETITASESTQTEVSPGKSKSSEVIPDGKLDDAGPQKESN